MARISFFLIFSLLILCCGEESTNKKSSNNPLTSGTSFTKLSPSKTGIDFSNELIEDVTNRHNILSFDYYYNGAGVALGDINNDGLTDIFFTANTSANKLYLNKGNMKFEDISKSAGIQPGDWSTGVNMADVNNDGWLDIYVCQAGPTNGIRKNLLYINKQNNTFQESAQSYGLADPKLGTQAAFFDYNRDGLLDCYLMNESTYFRVEILTIQEEIKDEKKLKIASGTLYKNIGGRFVDVSKEAGILRYGYGLGLAVSDFNNDGWPDFYVANDYSVPDMMWINQRDGTFKDEIKKRTDQTSWFSMGIDIADINNDGFLDIGVVDMATQDHFYGKTLMAPMSTDLFHYTHSQLKYQRQHMFNALQMNHGNGTYSNIAGMTKTLSTEWSWASLFADFDNDGDKDYFISNGFKRCHRDNDFQNKLKATKRKYQGKPIPNDEKQKLYDQIPSYKSKNLMYENNGFADFADVSDDWGVGDLSFSNGAAYADLDNDGDLDLVVNNINEAAFIYRNEATKNHLRIKLDSDTYTYGTRVTIFTGDKKQIQEYNPTKGYQSKVEDILHFGIDNFKTVDSVLVKWPDSKSQIIKNAPANQLITLSHKNAKRGGIRRARVNPLFEKTAGVKFKHTENEFDDFEKEILLPYKQSNLGPFMSVADVDKNGLDDFYIGGASGQGGKLFLQKSDGKMVLSSGAVFEKDAVSEDMKSTFFDADSDGDLDLYVISGGSEFKVNDPALQDRLYLNNGSGQFTKSTTWLPNNLTFPGMKAAASDIDKDGDLDLFVSGRITPQKYPYAADSKVLINNGNKFEDKSSSYPSMITNGITNDALWIDIDKDGDEDLITAGEWSPIKLFVNNDGEFSDPQEISKAGWWYTLASVDIDNDGDLDLVGGNLGLNSKFKASEDKPFKVYADDFDNNGTCDVVLAKQYKGQEVPVRGRQCSSEQMPFIQDKFETYSAFAKANLSDILGEDRVNNSLALAAESLHSSIFINENGQFTEVKLPMEAQAFPIWGIEVSDLNNDNYQDLILTGNLYGMEIETPRLDAGKGLVLLNREGKLDALNVQESGILIRGDLRDIILLEGNQGKKKMIVSRNNDSLVSYELNE